MFVQFFLDCHNVSVIAHSTLLEHPYMISGALAGQLGSVQLESFHILLLSCELGLVIVCAHRMVMFIEATGEPTAKESTFSLPYCLNYKEGSDFVSAWPVFFVIMILVHVLSIDYKFYGIEKKQEYVLSKLVENINDYSDIIIHSHPIHFYQYGDYHRDQAGLYSQLLTGKYKSKLVNLGDQTRSFSTFYHEIDSQWE